MRHAVPGILYGRASGDDPAHPIGSPDGENPRERALTPELQAANLPSPAGLQAQRPAPGELLGIEAQLSSRQIVRRERLVKAGEPEREPTRQDALPGRRHRRSARCVVRPLEDHRDAGIPEPVVASRRQGI